MININKMLNFSNLSDKNYRNLLIYSVLSGILSQSLLLPSLDYLALGIKHDVNSFYDYATLATIAATLPPAISLAIGYLVNNLSFKRLLKVSLVILLISSLTILMLYKITLIYVSWIILCGVIFNALFLNLSRQICAIIGDKMKSYQNDNFLFGSLGNMLGFQLGNIIYNSFHLHGVIISFIVGFSFALTLIKQVDFNQQIEAVESNKIKILMLINLLGTKKQLMVFLVIIFSFIFIESGFNLFILAKIHQLDFDNSVYAKLFSILTAAGFISSVVIKNPKIQKLDNFATLIFAGLWLVLFYVALAFSITLWSLFIIVFIYGFANVFFLINMNTICFNFMNADKELLKIAPVVNGFMTTGFYSLSLLGPLLYNALLKSGLPLNLLSTVVAILGLLVIVCLGFMVKNGYFKVSNYCS